MLLNMIETLISSKTRIKLLLKFFLNSNTRSYLRNLESEFGESTNAIRLELNKFEKAGMLLSESEGNKKIFKANTGHPLFNDLHNIVKKYVGLDWIVDYVAKELGNLQMVYLGGAFANGSASDTIDLVFIGKINETFLRELCTKVSCKINKDIQYNILKDRISFDKLCEESGGKYLLLWEK